MDKGNAVDGVEISADIKPSRIFVVRYVTSHRAFYHRGLTINRLALGAERAKLDVTVEH